MFVIVSIIVKQFFHVFISDGETSNTKSLSQNVKKKAIGRGLSRICG